ncbi:MAG: NAD-dependent epimerase/dehydratase family protein [Deltaproteobacteria bacterium]|nr:NAD-dependent epimerase/dehydratase family protein [Deltaproteobacteria bacterium]MBW2360416.1 NAD-dependent epimerase/dehydratase family protein [Deltaproteobacteria bacterium]
MSEQRVLVTGGAGFIGSAVGARFAAGGHAVRVLDDLSTGRREHCDPSWELIEGDIADPGVVEAAVAGCAAVAHLAAFVSVPASFERREECERTNIAGTRDIIAACLRHGVHKLVFASSCSVYAEGEEDPLRETATPGPKSPYAESKLEGERLLAEADLASLALRFFNVYGPRQRAGAGYAAAVPNFMRAALAGEALSVFGDGRQSRDFVHVADVAEAVFQAAHRDATGVLNVGTGSRTEIAHLAQTIARLAGQGAELRFESARPGDMRSATADVTRVAAALGWRAAHGIEQGLAETLVWWRTRMAEPQAAGSS